MKERIFLKIGGSFLTDKNKENSLDEDKIRKIARTIVESSGKKEFELVMAHGAGSYGHIKAKDYSAQNGIHQKHGWKAFYEIRQDMIGMNLKFSRICEQEKLFPITIQPSAILTAYNGKIISIHSRILKKLLEHKQIPLIHGDIIVDEAQGFTIASTEDILQALSQTLFFHRVIMVSDVPGVLDDDGKIIPIINRDNFKSVSNYITGSNGIDVTGGMRTKVEQLYRLIHEGYIKSAYIISCNHDTRELENALFGSPEKGTIIK